jgi:hypothetical protein
MHKVEDFTASKGHLGGRMRDVAPAKIRERGLAPTKSADKLPGICRRLPLRPNVQRSGVFERQGLVVQHVF